MTQSSMQIVHTVIDAFEGRRGFVLVALEETPGQFTVYTGLSRKDLSPDEANKRGIPVDVNVLRQVVLG